MSERTAARSIHRRGRNADAWFHSTVRLAISFVLLAGALAACSSPDSDSGVAATQIATSAATSARPTTAPTTAQATATQPAGNATAPTPGTPVPTPTTTAATPVSSPASDASTLSAYFIRNDKIGVAHRNVSPTQQVATSAMQELLNGPNAAEKSAGLSSSIPPGTKLLGVVITNKVASVDLSSEFQSGPTGAMAPRLAQVVYTLTQFSTVESVEFKINGAKINQLGDVKLDRPVNRATYEPVTPAILVETPAVGDTISSPVRLQGTANTFEAAFSINILDNSGKLIAEKNATATSGTGTRGTFDVSVPLTSTLTAGQAGPGKVVVFEISARDGSKTNVVEIPVTLK